MVALICSFFLYASLFFIFLGVGVVEMDDDDVSCEGKDGEVAIVVKRKHGNSFPTDVMWSATKPSSMMQQLVIEEGKYIIMIIPINCYISYNFKEYFDRYLF